MKSTYAVFLGPVLGCRHAGASLGRRGTHRGALLACVAFARVYAAAADVESSSVPVMDPTKPAYPGILTSSDPSQPPPFVQSADPGHLDPPADPETAAISAAARAKVDAAIANWKAADGGAEFFPGLTYMRGKPILMLVTTKQETDELKGRRLRSVVTALESLLDGTSFEQATICIVAQEVRDAVPLVKNHVIRRQDFEATARSAAAAPTVKAAVAKARVDAAAARKICSALGID